jgi:hypothetical protein
MSVGGRVDQAIGMLSRGLHGLRGPKNNTILEVQRYYLDRRPEELFPAPQPLEDVTIERTLVSRALRASTLSWRSMHRVLSPEYRRLHETVYRDNLTAWARWLRPDGRMRARCLVYVHGWLEPGSWVEEALVFPRWVRELGVDVVHVSLPFHGKRNPRHALFSGEYFWTADLVRSIEGVRQAMHDVRAIVEWLRRQRYAEVGVAGVSLGGALTMILACLEPLPDYVIPIVCHLKLEAALEHASILWRMKKDLERWNIGAEHRLDVFRRLGISSYLPLLAPDRQLWVNARDDAHIDSGLVLEQWRAWGKPNLHWIPGGHMTFPLYMPDITSAMGRFLDGLERIALET